MPQLDRETYRQQRDELLRYIDEQIAAIRSHEPLTEDEGCAIDVLEENAGKLLALHDDNSAY